MLFPVPSPFGLAGCAVPCPELTGACGWRLLGLGTGRSGAVWERRAQLADPCPLPCIRSCIPFSVVIAGSRPSGCRLLGAQTVALR